MSERAYSADEPRACVREVREDGVEVVIYGGPLPEREEAPLSEAEQAFLEMRLKPREFAAWSRETLKAWHKRTGVPMRRAEA